MKSIICFLTCKTCANAVENVEMPPLVMGPSTPYVAMSTLLPVAAARADTSIMKVRQTA
jgi:hypothetical protein